MITQEQAKELLEILIKDNDYAEIFQEVSVKKSYKNFNNKRFTPTQELDRGTAIRTWKGKEISFISIDSLEFTDIKEKINTQKKEGTGKAINFSNIFEAKNINNFGDWTIDKIHGKLQEIVQIIKKDKPLVAIATSALTTTTRNTLLANSDEAFIKKTEIYTALSYTATAKREQESEFTYDSISKSMNVKEIFDILASKQEQQKIQNCANLAIKLLDAPRIKSDKMAVILPNGFGGVLFHEAVGHPLEATQVAKGTSVFNGKMGHKIATDLVTLVDDGTIANERGTAPYDDEGVKNKRRVLINKGVLTSYLIDKHNGSIYMNQAANGAGRRENYRYMPTSRMSNTFIENGTSNVEDIIKATDYGFYAKKLGGGQVDPFSGDFNFGVSEGYLIEKGKIKHLVKNATLIGNGIEAIKKIDMVANDFALGAGTCGSLSGLIPCTVGQPTLRVKSMTVGGK